jgi:double-stranded uracil-DNA glycosylase
VAAVSAAELEAARGTLLPDVLGPDPVVLFCGINPGLLSAATGHHFARPGNRFWPALHGAGFTPRLLRPAEQAELPRYGVALTNLVARATARADELTPAELRAGARRLEALVRKHSPRWVAIVGITAHRTAFTRPKAVIGRQPEQLGPARLWVLPNPSGLNAHYQLPALTQEFENLRTAAYGGPGQGRS